MSATIAAELGEVVFGSPHYRVLFLIGVLLFSALLLRDLERIRPITVVSATAIVAGAILVSL